MTPLPIDHVELDRILNQLRQLEGGVGCPSVLVTGVARGAGASTLAWALAQRAVLAGMNVLFLDLDPLTPYTERMLALELEDGSQPADGILTRPWTQPGRTLDIARFRRPAGGRRKGHDQFEDLQEALATMVRSYDLIIADGAPVAARRTSGAVDGCALSPLFDLTYLTVAGAVTSQTQLQQAADRITEMGGRTAGIVLNEREMELPFQGLERRFRQATTLFPWLPRLFGFRSRNAA